MVFGKNWRERLSEEAEKEATNASIQAIQEAATKLNKIEKVVSLKKRVVACLREEPKWIFGYESVYIRTDNHLLAHDVAKELEIDLKRTAQKDGINYDGKYEGINICIYGMETAANCKLVRKTIMKEVEIVELICNDEAAQT